MSLFDALTGAMGGLVTGGPIGAAVGGIGGVLGGGGAGGGLGVPNQALATATMTTVIAQMEKGVKAGTSSPPQLNALVSSYHNIIGGGSGMLQGMQQQNMQNLMFQQQVNQQSQQFTTLSNAQKAMHDAIMGMLNNCK